MKYIMLEILYVTFLETTDPLSPYEILVSKDVAFSICLHMLLYFCIYLGMVDLFNIPNNPVSFLIILFSIMCFGYVGRLARSKSIYNVLLHHGNDKESAREKAKAIIREAYFTWYYLA